MTRILVVTIKEVRSYLQDRADLAFGILLPIVIFALMYGAFSNNTLFNGTAYVVNDDPGGAYSQILIERLDELENLEVEPLTWSMANYRLSRSDVLLFVYIPEGFSNQLACGKETEIIFRQRGNGGQEGQIVASLVREVAAEMSQEIQVAKQVQRALIDKGIDKDHIQTVAQNLIDREREYPVVNVREITIGADIDMVQQFLPGIITMFVLFAITMSSRTLVEERKKGTLERLLTTRLTVGELYLGKFLASVSRGFVQTLILLVLAYIVFQIFTPLSFLVALLLALVFSAAGSTIGLIIASVSHTEDQATWISVFFTMSTVMLGGTFFVIPRDSILYYFTWASMNTYANSAFKTVILRGGALNNIALELSILLGVIVVGLIISRILFRVIPGGK